LTNADNIAIVIGQGSDTSRDDTMQQTQMSLPPLIIGLIITVTAVTIIGSAFWLIGSKKLT
jgi:hypothetical protein